MKIGQFISDVAKNREATLTGTFLRSRFLKAFFQAEKFTALTTKEVLFSKHPVNKFHPWKKDAKSSPNFFTHRDLKNEAAIMATIENSQTGANIKAASIMFHTFYFTILGLKVVEKTLFSRISDFFFFFDRSRGLNKQRGGTNFKWNITRVRLEFACTRISTCKYPYRCN